MDQKDGAFHGKLTLSWTEILTGLAVIVLGVILVIAPNLATSVIFNVIGIGAILIGIVHVIRYCRLDAHLAVMSNDMALGLAWILGGVAVMLCKKLLVSFLPIIFGLLLLLGGIVKIQRTLSLRQMKTGRWYYELVCSIISIVMGVLIIINPFSTALLLMRVIGIFLIIEGVMDMGSRIAYKRARNRYVDTHFID